MGAVRRRPFSASLRPIEPVGLNLSNATFRIYDCAKPSEALFAGDLKVGRELLVRRRGLAALENRPAQSP